MGYKYILNGTKHYITNATEADVFTVMAVTDPSKGVKGITSFIVEKKFPGFLVGAVENKMGLRGSSSAEIILVDCEVPIENVLGEEGQGYINALKILANGRAGLAARNLGSSQKLKFKIYVKFTRLMFPILRSKTCFSMTLDYICIKLTTTRGEEHGVILPTVV